MTVHVCVPTLKRYDLLRNMLKSLEDSTVHVHVHVIDNGKNPEAMRGAIAGIVTQTNTLTPNVPMGLAEAWNWFIANAPEPRVICNDDITFIPTSLAEMLAANGEFVTALPGSNAFSCFLLRDSLIEKIGLFDPSISPGYAYFEDCDYVHRMIQNGVPITGVLCGVEHVGSQTSAQYTGQEWEAHHRKFMTAQSNFVRKWGHMPDEAKIKAQYDAQAQR